MKTITERRIIFLLLVWLTGLWCLAPVHAFPLVPPPETLAGLTPGISTVADASRLFGVYDQMAPGHFSGYAGGSHAANSYAWTTGTWGNVPGLYVETSIGSPLINMVVVDDYPGLGTSCGLKALMSERQVIRLYGYPDYAYEITFDSGGTVFHELYYVERGLLVVLEQVNGRMNWTISKLILTYPTYLRNAVAQRSRYAASGANR